MSKPRKKGYHGGTIKTARRILNILTEAEKPLILTDIRKRIIGNGLKETLSFLLSIRLIKKEYINYIQKSKGNTTYTAKYWHYSLK